MLGTQAEDTGLMGPDPRELRAALSHLIASMPTAPVLVAKVP